MISAARWLLALAPLWVGVGPARAQHADHAPNERWLRFGAHAVGLITRTGGGPFGIDHTEGYLTQPLAMAMAEPFGGRVFGRLTLDIEGITLERGELNLGGYGEGYVDRRHPHTYLHEAIVGLRGRVGLVSGSIAAGKGFVPFGSDDPMVRPFVKYPVNHHLAQVLERALVVVGVRAGRVLIEGAAFNGDEPEGPGTAPRADRFGDSWATRVTLAPFRGFELSGSYAFVESPELRRGGGLDQGKWHLGARYSAADRRLRYAFLEWGRTIDYFGKVEAFRFATVVAEASVAVGGVDVSGRLERTTRPEEDRLLDPFRSPRPLADLNIIGVTRWRSAAVALARPIVARGRISASGFVEGTYLRPKAKLSPTVFVPEQFYGRSSLWMLSAGVRVAAGHDHKAMGRYGVADR
jgi:hypothetical protein